MKHRETVLFLTILGVVLILLFVPVLLRGETFALGDVPDQFLPWRIFTAEEIAEGRVPLWNPYTFCGSPFLANMQSAVLYPIDRLVDLFFQPERGIGIGMLLHLFLGGGFLFLLARSFGVSELSSGIAAIGYALGGFHAIHFLGGNLLTITSSIYLPAHLWVVHTLRVRLEEGKGIGLIPWVGILLAVLQVLSGHAQMTFYNTFFVGVFVLTSLLTMKTGKTKFMGLLVGIAVCAILVAAPQILPTLEYSRHSSRTGLLPYLPATEFSFGWEFLVSFFLPELLGTRADMYTPLHADTYWGDWKNWSGVYLGFLPALGFLLFFILNSPSTQCGEGARGWGLDPQCGAWASGWGLKKRILITWLPLLLVALILSLGRNTPIYWYIHHHFPLFGKFRAPSKFLPGFIVPFAVIGALGIDDLFSRLSQVRMCHKRAFAWGATSILAGAIAYSYAANPEFLSVPIQKTAVVHRELLRCLAMILMTVGVLLFYIRSRRPKQTGFDIRLAQVALLLFIAFDVGSYCKKYLVFGPYERIERFPTDWLRSEIGRQGRLLVSPEVPQINNCVSGRILTAGGYDPFQVGDYVDHFREMGIFEENQIPDGWSPTLASARELGVTHVLTSQPLNSPMLEPQRKKGSWMVYRAKETHPLIEFFPSGAIESASAEPISFGWEDGELLISGSASSAGRIVIRNVYMPGWVALDPEGKQTSVALTSPFWQSLPVEAGDFEFVLVYDPDSWKWGVRLFWGGMFLTLMTAVGLVSNLRNHKGVNNHAIAS